MKFFIHASIKLFHFTLFADTSIPTPLFLSRHIDNILYSIFKETCRQFQKDCKTAENNGSMRRTLTFPCVNQTDFLPQIKAKITR